MSNVVEDLKGPSYFTSSIGGAVRWAAPELYGIHGSDEEGLAQYATSASDVYSYGCVCLEVSYHLIPRTDSDGDVDPLWRRPVSQPEE